MTRNSAANTRAKHSYFRYLREAKGRSAQSIDKSAKAIARFEEMTRHRDFKKLHREQVRTFKRDLADVKAQSSGQLLSASTYTGTLRELREFFQWLSREPGYRGKIAYSDADYFNPSERESQVARATRPKTVPTLEQVHHVLSIMPSASVIERRDRALIAFALITGARDGALSSFKLKHVDLAEGMVLNDARDVRTKGGATFPTYFVEVGGDARSFVTDWVHELRDIHLWGDEDPLFPRTFIEQDENGSFRPVGIARAGWSASGPVRAIFRKAFVSAGLPYFNPHSFRAMLTRYGMRTCRNPEELKAWSMNLGHKEVLTTLVSYGELPRYRQAELIRGLGKPPEPANEISAELIDALVARLVTKR